MTTHPAEKLFTRAAGPIGIAAHCNLCRHKEFIPKAHKPGRGWGLRETNKLRGRMIQHVKQCHPEVLKKDNNHD